MKNHISNLKYKQSVINYASRFGVTNAANKFSVSRSFIYKWRNRYDGSLDSLKELSRRPHHSPNESLNEEYTLIYNHVKRNPNLSLVDLWVKLRRKGYSRNITTLYRILKRKGLITVPPKDPYIPKEYEAMSYPGERVQIDVKHVPSISLTSSLSSSKYYQYTCIDEYSRYRYLEIFDDKSTYSSYRFILNCMKYMPFEIECVQTDNGLEFTNRLLTNNDKLTLFEEELLKRNIRHKLIKPYTPRHNGKVERSHRKDNIKFYGVNKFITLKEMRDKLRKWNNTYNNFPMRPLGWLSPIDYLNQYYSTQD